MTPEEKYNTLDLATAALRKKVATFDRRIGDIPAKTAVRLDDLECWANAIELRTTAIERAAAEWHDALWNQLSATIYRVNRLHARIDQLESDAKV